MQKDVRFENMSDEEITSLLDTIDMSHNEGSSQFLELDFQKSVWREVYLTRALKHKRIRDVYNDDTWKLED